MRPLLIAVIVTLLALSSVPSVGATPTQSAYGLTHTVTTANFSRMVDFVMIPGSNDEAIVLLQEEHKIWRVSLSGAFQPTLYGDLTAYANGGGEEGLLSAAFSPSFATDGRIYIYYTQGGNSQLPTVLSRFQVSGNAIQTGAETRILEIPDFANNHNGGKLIFGNDGYLYLSLGDGGGGGDPQDRGQDIDSLLGKVVRINVTGQPTYTIPPDNPFVGTAGRDEIYAWGLRNPWRMGKDSVTGTIWVGDVGQGEWEEVEPLAKGANYGWDCYEGFEAFETAGCAAGGFTFPRAVYDHGLGCAVTGGTVYRGALMPELYGWYVYADHCSGRIWALDASPGSSTAPVQLLDSSHFISSFGERPDGELLVLTFSNAIYLLHNDGDGDGLPAHQDNCPAVSNASGQDDDVDGDLAGDACDAAGSGNVNCDGSVNSVDSLAVLRHSAGLGVLQNEPCLNPGQPRLLPPPDNDLMGDVNCFGGVNSIDALLILRAVAGLSTNIPPNCPEIDP
jgi:glucose/arabinose dehydrogenase